MAQENFDCPQCGTVNGPDSTRVFNRRHAGVHTQSRAFRCRACDLAYVKVYEGDVGGPLSLRETRPLEEGESAAFAAGAEVGVRVVPLESPEDAAAMAAAC